MLIFLNLTSSLLVIWLLTFATSIFDLCLYSQVKAINLANFHRIVPTICTKFIWTRSKRKNRVDESGAKLHNQNWTSRKPRKPHATNLPSYPCIADASPFRFAVCFAPTRNLLVALFPLLSSPLSSSSLSLSLYSFPLLSPCPPRPQWLPRPRRHLPIPRRALDPPLISRRRPIRHPATCPGGDGGRNGGDGGRNAAAGAAAATGGGGGGGGCGGGADTEEDAAPAGVQQPAQGASPSPAPAAAGAGEAAGGGGGGGGGGDDAEMPRGDAAGGGARGARGAAAVEAARHVGARLRHQLPPRERPLAPPPPTG